MSFHIKIEIGFIHFSENFLFSKFLFIISQFK